MAFIKQETLGVIDFVSPKDGAIDTDLNEETGEPRSDLEKYRETWDFEQYCLLKEDTQPTKFKVNFCLTHKKQILIDNASLGGDGKKEEFGFKLGKHKYTTVKCILVGIDNPDNLPLSQRIIFKKDNTGLVHDDTLTELSQCGIIEDLYSFYLTHKDNTGLLKKK